MENARRNEEKVLQLVKHIINHHKDFDWKKVETTAIYRYETDVNGIATTFRAFYSDYKPEGHYCIINFKSEGVEYELWSDNCKDLFKLEACLCEGETWETQEENFNAKVDALLAKC